MSYHVRGVGPDKAYYRAVQTVQTAVDEVRQCQKRVQRAKELLVDAQARSSASRKLCHANYSRYCLPDDI